MREAVRGEEIASKRKNSGYKCREPSEKVAGVVLIVVPGATLIVFSITSTSRIMVSRINVALPTALDRTGAARVLKLEFENSMFNSAPPVTPS